MSTDPFQNPFLPPSADGDSQQRFGHGMANIRKSVMTGQVITFAIVSGMVMITAVFILMFDSEQNPANPAAEPVGGGEFVLPGIGLAVAFVGIPLAFVIRAMVLRVGVNKFRSFGEPVETPVDPDTTLGPAPRGLLGATLASTVIGQALLDGVGVINLVLMIIDDDAMLHLAIVVVCVIGILLMIPTIDKVQRVFEHASEQTV